VNCSLHNPSPEKADATGRAYQWHWTWTDVFVKLQGRWQVVASQETLMGKTLIRLSESTKVALCLGGFSFASR
jgi:hypothetical protein